MHTTASSSSRRLRSPSPPRRRSRGKKTRAPAAATVTPAAAARDADGRAARRREREPVPAPLLALPGARPRAGGHGGPAARPGLVGAGLRAHRRCPSDDGRVSGRSRDRDGRAPGPAFAARRRRGRLRRVRSRAVPVQPVRAARNRLARTARACRSGGADRTRRRPAVASARLPARPGGLRPCRRIAGDAGHRRVPDGHRALLPAARREPGRALGRGLPRSAGDLAHTLPRRRAALFRPGGERPDEEDRCRPTSCSRA
jgi:hypothetical protein